MAPLTEIQHSTFLLTMLGTEGRIKKYEKWQYLSSKKFSPTADYIRNFYDSKQRH